MCQRAHQSNRTLRRRDLLGAGACGLALLGAGRAPAGDPQQPQAGSPTGGSIDAHVHVWTPDTKSYPLAAGFNKDRMRPPSFTPEELFAHARPCGVTRVVLIQMSFYGNDNSYMLDMMARHKGVFSGVARIDQEDKPRQAMRKLAARGVRGFRVTAAGRPPDRWLEGDGPAAMWRCGADEGLAICPLIDPEFLPSLDRMCRKWPKTPVVIDHLARIGIDGRIRQKDLDNLCRLARHKGVCVKVSAFYALGKKEAPYLDLGPMIRRVLSAFGRERLMWASDSPFQVQPPHTYQAAIDLVRRGLDFLSEADRGWLLRKTAGRVFFA